MPRELAEVYGAAEVCQLPAELWGDLSRDIAQNTLGLAKCQQVLMLQLAVLRDLTCSPKATGEHAQQEANL